MERRGFHGKHIKGIGRHCIEEATVLANSVFPKRERRIIV